MGFFDIFAKAAKRPASDQDKQYNAASIRIGEEHAAISVTSINQVDFNRVGRGTFGSVWNAASIVASECASQQLRLYRRAGAGKSVRKSKKLSERTQNFLKGKSITCRVTSKQAAMGDAAGEIEEVTDHPILDLLNDPDPMTTASDFLTMLYWYREVAGKAYVWCGDVSEGDTPSGLYLLHPHFTQPVLDREDLVSAYRYGREVSGIMEVPANQVLFSPWQRDPFRPWDGVSWISSIEQYADAENAALVSEVQRWKNHGQSGFILKVPMSYSDQQIRQVENALRAKSGPFAAGRALILRDIELLQSNIKSNEMGYVQGLEQSEKAIYRAAGVPEAIWKLNDANLAGAEIGERLLLRSCFKRMRRVAEDFTSYLLPMFEEEAGEMWFGYENPDLDDQTTEAQIMGAAFAAGVVDEAEYRKVLYLAPREQAEQTAEPTAKPLDAQQVQTLATLAASVSKGELGESNARAIANAAFPTMDPTKLDEVFAGLQKEEKKDANVAQQLPQQDIPEEQSTTEVAKSWMNKGESDINLTPPKGAQNAARRALEWRREFGRGGTAVGVARARDIANGRELSRETIMRMVSFFARHAVDAEAEGFHEGEDGFPSAGRIAWDLWGGSAAQSWSSRMAERLRQNEKSYRLKNCGTGSGGFQAGNTCAGGGGSGSASGSVPNATDLEQVKFLGGSTGAYLAEADDGSRWVIKGGNSAEHITNEAAANDIYEAAGVNVPQHKLDTTDANKPKQITKFVDKATPFGNLEGAERERAIDKIKKDFVVDALVANWDVIGMVGDNILMDKNMNPVRVDNGGALAFRAKGMPKDFGPVVNELDTMRKSDQGRDVFGKLTDKEVAEQITGVLAKSKEILNATPDALKDTMNQRMKYLWKYRANVLGGKYALT